MRKYFHYRNPYHEYIYRRWIGIYSRCAYYTRKNATYHRNHVRLLWRCPEFFRWFSDQLQKYDPQVYELCITGHIKQARERLRHISVDRLDPTGDYCDGNCRLISLHDNCSAGGRVGGRIGSRAGKRIGGRIGGRNRAATALRDKHGRFLPAAGAAGKKQKERKNNGY